MQKIHIEETYKPYDSPTPSGLVSVRNENGKLIVYKNNLIVKSGRTFFYNQFVNKLSEGNFFVSFGTGTDSTNADDKGIDESNSVDSVTITSSNYEVDSTELTVTITLDISYNGEGASVGITELGLFGPLGTDDLSGTITIESDMTGLEVDDGTYKYTFIIADATSESDTIVIKKNGSTLSAADYEASTDATDGTTVIISGLAIDDAISYTVYINGDDNASLFSRVVFDAITISSSSAAVLEYVIRF